MSEKRKSEKNKKDKPRCGCKSKKAPVSPTDPNGSYTGRPLDKHEIPVQDVDDL